MKKLIKNLLGRNTPPDSVSTHSRPPAEAQATIEDGSENSTRRQLVYVLLRDALRRYGIPARWIECQMLVVSSRSRGPGMYIRLVLKHWDYRMMNYTHAFQKALLTDIERFEPNSSVWLHGISWQLEVADTCPYVDMPDKSFWLEPLQRVMPASLPEAAATPNHPYRTATPEATQLAASTAASDEAQARLDLEQLFAIRDRELNREAMDDEQAGRTPFGYEATQPAPLR